MSKIADENQMDISIPTANDALTIAADYTDSTSTSVIYIWRDEKMIAAKDPETGDFLWGEDALNEWTENADENFRK